MDASNVALVRTCLACPEQYDAIDATTGDTIGYLRLRHGHFTVEVPDVYGELVYESYPEGDGIFEEDERDAELAAAILAIAEWYE